MKRKTFIVILCIILSNFVVLFGRLPLQPNNKFSCKIINPDSSFKFSKHQMITIIVEIENVHKIKEVRFFVDNMSIGSIYGKPYRLNWNTDDISIGKHILKVIAINERGESVKDIVHITYFPLGAIKWKTKYKVSNSPAIGSDGTLYATKSGYLYAINPDGTTQKKSFISRDVIRYSPVIGIDGTIYIDVYATDYNLYAVNPDGSVKWRTKVGYKIKTPPTLGKDGSICIGTDGFRSGDILFAINPDGTEKWKYNTKIKHRIETPPTLGKDGSIYIGIKEGHTSYLYALYSDGTGKWKFNTHGDISSNPIIGKDGTVYIGSESYIGSNSYSRFYAIDSDGTEKWKIERSVLSSIHSAAIGSNGIIYAASQRYLYAIDPSGIQKWEFKTLIYKGNNPVIGKNNTILIGKYALNPDGTKKWKFESILHKSPIIGADGTIYSLSGGGVYDYFLYAFNGETKLSDGVNKKKTIIFTKPNISKIKEDLIGKKISGWTFDYLSEFRDAKILNTTNGKYKIEYTVFFKLYGEKSKSEHDCEINIIYVKGYNCWYLKDVEMNYITYINKAIPNRWTSITPLRNCKYSIDHLGNKYWVKDGSNGKRYMGGPDVDDESFHLKSSKIYLMSRESGEVKIKFTYKPKY